MAKLSEELKREMKLGFKEIQDTLERDYRSEMREMKSAMEHMSNVFDDMNGKFTALLDEQKKLKSENEALQKGNNELKASLKAAEKRVTECEQYMRNRNIEIKGVPLNEQQDVGAMISSLWSAIGEPSLAQRVDIMHSVPIPNSDTMNIILQFKDRQTRDFTLTKCKGKRLSTLDLGLTTKIPVFVNEHLCPTLKRTLGVAISKKKESKLAFAWVKNGKVYVRKSEGEPSV
ncbi:uncharacterized protein LOC135384679 [Ornithodoros turicata]|uniref:uncharacterized protein LOC135384679 n=1 Tax=Ornithodoros turicata TaxID=34597 RepID=UPI003138F674